MLRTFGHPVAMCCDMLGVVGSNLKMLKFFIQLCARACALVQFQYPTRRNRVAKRTQHVTLNNVAICCVEMLRSFGRGLRRKRKKLNLQRHIHDTFLLKI